MKQVLQTLRDGITTTAEVPAPRAGLGQLLIYTTASLISPGTERMLVDFGKANWLEKARQQPDKVREVLDKAKTDGVLATLEAVRSKLNQPLALGYCNTGRVAAVGQGVSGFSVGDRVSSNGKHAEVVAVPKHLCAKIPDGVSDAAAAFTVTGAIGLQGIRLADPKLGECVVVVGLGLIGLMTVQMLRAQGCRVLGIDFNSTRLELARCFGAETVNLAAGEDALVKAEKFSRGVGVDAVIVTASTKSNDPVALAAKMSRKRGRIVLIGVAGLQLSRSDFYEKELTFQVSCSYGPGRYDPTYEEGGQDYPIGFVRWTEQRNFEAVLYLMASGTLNVNPLISHTFEIERAKEAFELLTNEEPSLGILLQYKSGTANDGLDQRTVPLSPSFSHDRFAAPVKATTAFLGAGNYTARCLFLPSRPAGARLKTVVSVGGVSAFYFGTKHGFSEASTDGEEILEDPAVDTVVVATRHDAHARQVLSALRAGKHVFCEKPLCLTFDELTAIEEEALARLPQLLMLGFNRRFAPLTRKAKNLIDCVAEPKAFIMTVNAGTIPATHWTQDPAVGGGRIVGEVCHFIDLIRYFVGAPIRSWHAMALGRGGNHVTDDRATISMSFEDGSTGVIHYLANGHKSFPKERLEVFAGGSILQLDNFRSLRGWGWSGFSKVTSFRQDKGQFACAKAFVHAVKGRLGLPDSFCRDPRGQPHHH